MWRRDGRWRRVGGQRGGRGTPVASGCACSPRRYVVDGLPGFERGTAIASRVILKSFYQPQRLRGSGIVLEFWRSLRIWDA
ncbi:unnamed protein product [Victoria cruziana]